MLDWKRSSWWSLLIVLALLPLFIVVKWNDPTKVDRVLDDLSRRWVGWALSQYYFLSHPASQPIAIGLFEDSYKEDSYKKDVSKQPPTLERYAQIIDKLIDFGVSEIVIDLDMRVDGKSSQPQDALVAALNRARAAKIPVVIPYVLDDDAKCSGEMDDVAATSVLCAAAARRCAICRG